MKLSTEEMQAGAVNIEDALEKKSVQSLLKAFEDSVYTNESEGKKVSEIFLKLSLFLLLEHSDSVKSWADMVSLNIMRVGDSMTEEGVDVMVDSQASTKH